jgi:hypothetical protein
MDSFGPAYRGLNGTKCAVGHILTDAEYNPFWESKVIARIAEIGQLPARLVPHRALLVQLQDAHDTEYCEQDRDEWEKAMEQIAKEHGLHYQAFAERV